MLENKEIWYHRLKNPVFLFAIISFGLILSHVFGLSPAFFERFSEDTISIIGSMTAVIGSIGCFIGILSKK